MGDAGPDIVDFMIAASVSLSPSGPSFPSHIHRNDALAHDACCAEPILGFGSMQAKSGGPVGDSKFPRSDERFFVVANSHPVQKGLHPSH
jgi:hypothetical protein